MCWALLWCQFVLQEDAIASVKNQLEWISGLQKYSSGALLVCVSLFQLLPSVLTTIGAPNSIATLRVDMSGDEENILSMENFDGMLTAVECTNGTVAMTFESDATFAYAQRVWDWVNGADNRSFVMVAGPGDCGNNTNRQPYVVSSIQYDEVANKATLAATEGDWTSIAHSYELVVGSVAQNATGPLPKHKRDIEKTSSIDFNHDMTGSFGLGIGKLDARITCLNCSTTGQFDMEFKISQKLFVPTGASMKFSPKGVTAIAQMKLSGSGDLTDSLTKTFDILSIPISGLKIPGVLDFGPFLTVSIGAELSAITLTAGVTSGATGSLSDDAIVELDMLNPEKNTFSGWEPTVDILDVVVDGSISGGVAVFMQPSMELKFEALGTHFPHCYPFQLYALANRYIGKGFRIGLDLKVPNINAKLTGIICESSWFLFIYLQILTTP